MVEGSEGGGCQDGVTWKTRFLFQKLRNGSRHPMKDASGFLEDTETTFDPAASHRKECGLWGGGMFTS